MSVDRVTPEARSRNMVRVRGKDTKLELEARRSVFAAGFRYRLHAKELPGRPDLVLPRYRTAVFVHGCFWHGHDCKKGKRPASNTDFWNWKLDRNIARDREKLDELKATGWTTFVVWQCSLKDDVSRLVRQLEAQRSNELTR
ncbi:MAG: very short patch repair endonuclease [Sphingomonadales bacterium]